MSIVLDGTSGVVTPNINTANTFGFKNLLIDAGFTINQRAYVSGATLASGSYGHDRWKAGASGGDYTFTQLASSTTITIASGKSLIQVIEDKNVNGTSFVLSWTGTAQARFAVNGATPSGSYAASPILITGQTVGTTMSVEFNTGTLSKPQLELGSTATSFDVRDYGRELSMCQRYCYAVNPLSNSGLVASGWGYSTTKALVGVVPPVPMRSNPTLTRNGLSLWSANAGLDIAVTNITTASVTYPNLSLVYLEVTVASGLTVGQGTFLQGTSSPAGSGYLILSAEL
jgi:hypothetical protein